VGEIWNRRDDEPTRLGRHTNPVDAFSRELRTGGRWGFHRPRARRSSACRPVTAGAAV